LAHLITFLEHGNRVQSHGKEWKSKYAVLLKSFINLDIFPQDILDAIQQSLHNLPASSCADEDLMRVLKRYDKHQNGLVMVEQIRDGNLFEIDKGKVFKKGKKLRKRYQCVEVNTGKVYLFSPVYEVKAV
jgi:predicted SprT family Zn-dependent metalloprotease